MRCGGLVPVLFKTFSWASASDVCFTYKLRFLTWFIRAFMHARLAFLADSTKSEIRGYEMSAKIVLVLVVFSLTTLG